MAFNTALSGIAAAGEELGVVGNNIANANTVGFKGSRAEFADVYAATSLGTGANAVGSGVRLTDVNQQFSQGSVRYTGNSLDLAISGEGFFQLNDGGSVAYSRAGNFKVDNEGYIVNSTNQRLVGFIADKDGDITGLTGDLKLNSSNIPPSASTALVASLNFDSTEATPAAAWVGSPTFGDPQPAPNTFNYTNAATVYDSLGNAHTFSLYLVKTTTPNEWDAHFQIDGVDVDASPAAAPFKQVFNSDGSFDVASSDSISLNWAPIDANTGLANGATTPQSLGVTLSDSTQFGSVFAMTSLSQNGFTTGKLDGLNVDPTGVILGRYSNGENRAMGQLFLQNFTNNNGLQPLGDTSWSESFASGPPLRGEPGSANLGTITSGAVEESNVKLTEQLVQLILAQRNFQANAQTIRTADTVTQTIINLR